MVKLTYIGNHDCYAPGLGANEDKEVTEAEAPVYLETGLWVAASEAGFIWRSEPRPAADFPAAPQENDNVYLKPVSGEEPASGEDHEPTQSPE